MAVAPRAAGVAITGNPFFIACVSSLIDNLEGNAPHMDINMGTTTLDHHRAIHRGLERRDGGAAEAAMREHIRPIPRRLEPQERHLRGGR